MSVCRPEHAEARGADKAEGARAGTGRGQMAEPALLGLQRMAGNQAVLHLLAVRGARPPWPTLPVQRDDPPAAEPDQRTPAERVDAVTFDGFSTWADSAKADADESLTEAGDMADVLASPYKERLGMLIGEVTGATNTLDLGCWALREGRAAPALTTDPTGFAHRFEHDLQVLQEVTEAWQAVTTSAVMTLIGMIAEAQVERARALRSELERLANELRALQAVAQGEDLREAFAQLGINTAITVALLAITFTNPFVGVAIAVGSAGVQCTLDELLGPSGNDVKDVVAVGVGVGGSATEAAAAIPKLASASGKLRVAGRRMGGVGAAMGTALDVLETHEAIAAYEAAGARVREISARLERVSRQLEPLRPLLAYPALAARTVERIQTQAATLRENGQVVLQQHSQL